MDLDIQFCPTLCVEIEKYTFDPECNGSKELAGVMGELDCKAKHIYYSRKKKCTIHCDMLKFSKISKIPIFFVYFVNIPLNFWMSINFANIHKGFNDYSSKR